MLWRVGGWTPQSGLPGQLWPGETSGTFRTRACGRFHYLSFLHLYTGDSAKPGPHPREMRLCELHLRVLLTLSVHKTAYIAQTMHKLQVSPHCDSVTPGWFLCDAPVFLTENRK